MGTLKRWLSGALCLALLLFINHPASLYISESNSVFADAMGTVYYVATSGNDNNPGTLSAPWRTIQKASDSVRPGDTVYVRGGVYNEFVNIKVSGSAESGRITFRNYEKETPIIDGTGLSLSRSQALVQLSNVNFVTIAGFEIRNLSTSSSSADPAGIRVKDGSSQIEILNNNVHHIENTSKDGNGHGIHVLGNTSNAITGLVISGNQVHHLITGKSESLTLSGNIDGFSVTNNRVYENNNIGIELAGFYGACSGSCVDQTRNGVVSGNIVYRIDSSGNKAYGTGIHAAGGIYADGATKVIIERNEIYNSDFGIELASEKRGKTTSGIVVRNNYIHDNYGAGLIMGGSSSSNGGASQNVIVNNTFVENDSLGQGYGDITLQWNNTDNQFKNNIIFSNSRKLSVNKLNSSGSNNQFDYNLYYNSTGTAGSQWKWVGKSYSSLASYKQGTGNDTRSLFGNPLFANKAAHDIQLKKGSPAIDKGSALNPGEHDLTGSVRIRGAAIDIGAVEFSGSNIGTPAPSITIDGDAEDWSKIPVHSTGSGKASSMKAAKDAFSLYILVQGSELTTKSQLFINADNNINTGFKAPYWKSSGADYLLENGRLYRYNGSNGTVWKWEFLKSYSDSPNYFLSDDLLEVYLPWSDLGKLTQNSIVKIGYVWNDSDKYKLPKSGDMTAVQEILK